MIDEILQERHKRHGKDINIVPILDMLTTIIFFLLMSTSFIEYTKLTLPPASTVPQSGEVKTPPLAPKLLLESKGGSYEITLRWAGEKPGRLTATATETTISEEAHRLTEQFAKRYPHEKTVQVALNRLGKYQALVSLMDGAREYMPDIVLVSYRELDHP